LGCLFLFFLGEPLVLTDTEARGCGGQFKDVMNDVEEAKRAEVAIDPVKIAGDEIFILDVVFKLAREDWCDAVRDDNSGGGDCMGGFSGDNGNEGGIGDGGFHSEGGGGGDGGDGGGSNEGDGGDDDPGDGKDGREVDTDGGEGRNGGFSGNNGDGDNGGDGGGGGEGNGGVNAGGGEGDGK
jgi:hypothetical protein